MGTEKGFLKRGKPGLLSAITSFNETLQLYSESGADGKLPKKDKDGNIIPNQFIYPAAVASNMVAGISAFITTLNVSLAGKNFAKTSEDIKGQLGAFTNIIADFSNLAESQEGIDKLAASMGLLGTNVGILVTNLGGLNVEKLMALQTVESIAAKHARETKGVTIPSPGETSKSSALPSDEYWKNVAQIIANEVNAKLTELSSGEYDFHFYNGENAGKLEYKK
jgi:hypothetical protein